MIYVTHKKVGLEKKAKLIFQQAEFENPAKASGGFFSGVSLFGKKDGRPARSNDLLTHFKSMDSDGSGFVDQLQSIELRSVFKMVPFDCLISQ